MNRTYGFASWFSPTTRATRTPRPATTSTNTARIMINSMAREPFRRRQYPQGVVSRAKGVWGRCRGGLASRRLPLGLDGQFGNETIVEFEKTLDDDLRLADHGHEVRVPVPA